MRTVQWTCLARALAGAAMLAAAPALADGPAEDCLHGRSPARIRACTEAIAAGQAAGADLAALHRSRASALAEAGKTAEAVADIDTAIRLKPDSPQAFAARGQLRLATEDWDRALADYSEALRLNPRLQSAYIGRGFAAYSRGALDAAMADYGEAIALDARSAVAYNNRGLVWRRKDDLTRAVADYTKALEINPLYARAHINRGYAYEAMKKPADAIADFQQALAIDPGSTSARDGLKRLGAPVPPPDETAKLLAAGAALVQKNCAWCHAIGREGDSPNPRSPRFRDLHLRFPIASLAEPLSKGAVAPHSEMPRFQFSEREVASVIAYLNSLAPSRP